MVAVDVGFAKSNYVDEPASPNLLFEKSVPAAEILVGQYAQVAQSCGWGEGRPLMPRNITGLDCIIERVRN
jgi:hypothetical protein